MKKISIFKRLLILILVFILSINSFATVVSDNDGSTFITKAEFDSLKNNFQAQIDNYNTSIDSKIEGAIASYLAGIKTNTLEEIKPLNYSAALNGLIGMKTDYTGIFQMPYLDLTIESDRINVKNDSSSAPSDYLNRGFSKDLNHWWNTTGNGIALYTINPGKTAIMLGTIKDSGYRTVSIVDTTNPGQYDGSTSFQRYCSGYWGSDTSWVALSNTYNWTRSDDGLRRALYYTNYGSTGSSPQGQWSQMSMNYTLWASYSIWDVFQVPISTLTYDRVVTPITRGFYLPATVLNSDTVFSGESSYPAGYLIRFCEANSTNNYVMSRSTLGRKSIDLTGSNTYPSSSVFKFAPIANYAWTAKCYAMRAGLVSNTFWPSIATILWSPSTSYQVKPSWIIGPMDSYKPDTSANSWIFSTGGFDLATVNATNYGNAPFGTIPSDAMDHLQKANGCIPFAKLSASGKLKWSSIDIKYLSKIANDGQSLTTSSTSSSSYSIYLAVVGPITAENYTYGIAKANNKILKMKKGSSYLTLDATHHGYKIQPGDSIEIEIPQQGLYGLCWQLTNVAGTTEYNSFIPWASNTLVLEKEE